ncbi:hypothetical protein QWA_03020 [Alcaligenes faecalis subsp. faecalis NCIB 8687]|jgi:hypothetical protein|nr:hypothetical protein QWA_03020 [Alcaligenes faecalis subsp. faecalis NCIB 8687]
MTTRIASLSLQGQSLTVQLQVDEGMIVGVTIESLPGDRDTWTLGQIKEAALKSAASRLPGQ